MPGTPSGLSASSTYAQVLACYQDNASYFELQNTSYALAFVTACTMLLQQTPTMIKSAAGNEVQIDPAVLRDQLKEAKAFLAANGIYPGSSVPSNSRTSFEFLR